MLYTFAFYFAKNVNWVKIDPCCADVCAFLTMLMSVNTIHLFNVKKNSTNLSLFDIHDIKHFSNLLTSSLALKVSIQK